MSEILKSRNYIQQSYLSRRPVKLKTTVFSLVLNNTFFSKLDCAAVFSSFVLLVLVFSSSGNLQAQEKTVIKAGFYRDEPLYFMSGNNVTGLYGDILAEIAEKNNIEIEFIPGTFEDHLDNLSKGKIDILPGISENNSMNQTTILTGETDIFTDWFIVVHTNTNDLDFSSLSGMKIGFLSGGENYGNPHNFTGQGFSENFSIIKNPAVLKISLYQGNIDAAVLKRSDFKTIFTEKNTKLKIQNIILFPDSLFFGFRQESSFKNIFDRSLKEIKVDYKNYRKYFLDRYIYSEKSMNKIHTVWIFIPLAALSMILIFILVNNIYPPVRALSRTVRTVTSILDINTLLKAIPESISKILLFDYIGLGIISDETVRVNLYRRGHEDSEIFIVPEKESDSLIWYSLFNRKTVFLNSFRKGYSSYFPAKGQNDENMIPGNSLIMLPIAFNEDALGILYISSLRRNAFIRGELFFLRYLSRYLAIALRNAVMHSRIQDLLREIDVDKKKILKAKHDVEYLAYHDPLTDLPNRLYLDEYLKQAIKKACRAGKLLGVIFIDMDNFKQINDTYGHQTGDRVLVVAARRFRNLLRESDTVIRFGGDEFIIILEDITSIDDLKSVANKIINTCSTPLLIENRNFLLSFSLGISVYPYDGDSSDELIRKADIALYAVKNTTKGYWQFYSSDIFRNQA